MIFIGNFEILIADVYFIKITLLELIGNNMILETFYMIRGGNFGLNYAVKLYMTIFGLILCFIDYKTRQRKDYFWVYFWGTLIWGGIEFLMQSIGTRVTQTVYLYDWELPMFVTAILRGTSEGATIAVFGLFFGDRLFSKNITMQEINRKSALLGYFVITGLVVVIIFMQAVPEKIIDPDSPSRRDIFTPLAVITLLSFVIIDLMWMARTTSDKRRRAVAMLMGMVIFASIWTLSEFLANTRWIETGIPPNYDFAPPIIQFFVLVYDVVVEIGFCYLPYLILPYITHKIQEREKEGTGNQTRTSTPRQ